jgi:hypothetical protein
VTATGGTAPSTSIVDARSGLVAIYLDDAAIDITTTTDVLTNTIDQIQWARMTWENKSLTTAGGEASALTKAQFTGSAIDLNATKSRISLLQGFTYRVRVHVVRGFAESNWINYKVQGDYGSGTIDIPSGNFYWGDDDSNWQGSDGVEFFVTVPSTATAPYTLWLLRVSSGGNNGNSAGEWIVEAIAKESGVELPSAMPVRTITNADGSNVNGAASAKGYDGYPVQVRLTLAAGRAIASATVTNGEITVLNPLAGLVLVTPNGGNPVITIVDTGTSNLFSNWQKDVTSYCDNTWRTITIAQETTPLFNVNASGELVFNRDAVIDVSCTNMATEGSGLTLAYKIQSKGTSNVWYDLQETAVANPAAGVTLFNARQSSLAVQTGQMLRFLAIVHNGGRNDYPGARTMRLYVGEQLSTFVVPIGTTTRTVCIVAGNGANLNGNATVQLLGGTSGAVTATVPPHQRLATVTGSTGLTVAIEEAITGRISYTLIEGTLTASIAMTFEPIPPIATTVSATVDGVAANVNGAATASLSNAQQIEALITLPPGRQIVSVTANNGAIVAITNPRSGAITLLIPAGTAACAVAVTTIVSTARHLWTTANAGVAVTLGTIQLQIPTGGNRSLQIRTATGGNLSLRVHTWIAWDQTNQPSTANYNSTTWTYLNSGWSFGNAGNYQHFTILDTNNDRMYRGYVVINSSYNNNTFVLEEVI